LEKLLQVQGKVMLSGYPSELYDRTLAGWRIVDFAIDNKASSARSKPKMTERLWLNYDPPKDLLTAADARR
jgi:DNA adenine methylase